MIYDTIYYHYDSDCDKGDNVCHWIFQEDGLKHVPSLCCFLRGQSIGVIAPGRPHISSFSSLVAGPDKKGEQPAKIRLYSIASSAVGDDQSSKTVSLRLCHKPNRVVKLPKLSLFSLCGLSSMFPISLCLGRGA